MSTTRRSFFSWTRNALAATGVLRASPGEAAVPSAGVDYYDKLGVTKIINAAGTYTALTASTMPPPVLAALTEAARHPVRLAELQQKAASSTTLALMSPRKRICWPWPTACAGMAWRSRG